MIKQLFALALIIFCMCGCNSDENSTSVDRQSMLANIFDNAALPALGTFEDEAAALLALTDAFVDATTEANLRTVQDQWKVTKLSWEKVEVYDIDPIDAQFLHNKIDKYPLKKQFVERNLNDAPELITEDLVKNSGSTTKGLPVLEYLLFKAEDSVNVLEQFNDGPRADQYKNYLIALCKNLLTEAQNLKTEFTKIREGFVSNTEDGINGSVNNLANLQVGLIEEVLRLKLNKPLGAENEGTAQPQKVESPYANISLDAIKADLEGIQASFIADDNMDNLYSLLDEFHTGNQERLSTVIATAFEDCFNEIDKLNNPLQEIVVSNPSSLSNLNDAITRLGIAIKVDMANQLGLTIVFGDADGD